MNEEDRIIKTILKPTINNQGLFATHNMPCAVMQDHRAVFNCNAGVFEPCWEAQSAGFILIRVKSVWLRRKLQEWFEISSRP